MCLRYYISDGGCFIVRWNANENPEFVALIYGDCRCPLAMSMCLETCLVVNAAGTVRCDNHAGVGPGATSYPEVVFEVLLRNPLGGRLEDIDTEIASRTNNSRCPLKSISHHHV
ncbi:hypothetical protein C464_12945 [Halorubrum coriense DSM 10284]|uniref:Uncharacterized protein n=1 Tax=Halorubrum coriense DSM 10284 TaxID=1227466 RepID=M0EES5_9EURY|nr:hypothetical protein C464_12945 [Halorubrum coriense DSM 10284]